MLWVVNCNWMQHLVAAFYICGWIWKRKLMKTLVVGDNRVKESTYIFQESVSLYRESLHRLNNIVLFHVTWKQGWPWGSSEAGLRQKFREDQKTCTPGRWLCTLARKLVIYAECHSCRLLCLCGLHISNEGRGEKSQHSWYCSCK